ncbi:MAG TPA: hypothetical protein VHR66_23065 [Gemmataceae bacterium]|jgi:hypothetical protein|nr:hypothetical protein [Gemmataceae bacterium]
MIRFTPEALAYLDDYLAEVRSAVSGHTSVNPDEIEADVRDHVSAALERAEQPVTLATVADVLERLGPPTEWVADSHRSIWKYLGDKLKPVGHKAVEQIRTLPGEAYQAGRGLAARFRGLSHDWRLAYIAFGLFALGMIAFPLFPAFLIASYFAARADVALARERGEDLGARRWLVYPPMVVVSIVLFLALAIWPLAPAAHAGNMPRSLRADMAQAIGVSTHAVEPVVVIYTAIGAMSAWWIILSLVVLRFPKMPGMLFPPFGSRIRRSDALIVLLLSATVLVIWLSKVDKALRGMEVLCRL